MPAPILIGFDGSPSARQAIERAAHVLGPRPATVVFVWDPVAPGPAGDPFGLVSPMYEPTQLEGVNQTIRTNADAIAAQGAELAREAGLDAQPMTAEMRGSIWSTLLEVAEETGAELVVVGARGHSKVRSLLLGSVSNGVVHHTTLPVLVLPSRGTDADNAG
jgi:nucleotide-binding universal stress UspA family protein